MLRHGRIFTYFVPWSLSLRYEHENNVLNEEMCRTGMKTNFENAKLEGDWDGSLSVVGEY
jgi:hypothetical protein